MIRASFITTHLHVTLISIACPFALDMETFLFLALQDVDMEYALDTLTVLVILDGLVRIV